MTSCYIKPSLCPLSPLHYYAQGRRESADISHSPLYMFSRISSCPPTLPIPRPPSVSATGCMFFLPALFPLLIHSSVVPLRNAPLIILGINISPCLILLALCLIPPLAEISPASGVALKGPLPLPQILHVLPSPLPASQTPLEPPQPLPPSLLLTIISSSKSPLLITPSSLPQAVHSPSAERSKTFPQTLSTRVLCFGQTTNLSRTRVRLDRVASLAFL